MSTDEFFDFAENAPKFSSKKALSFKKGSSKKKFKKEGLRF